MTDAEIEAKLADLGLTLPQPAAPVAAYVPVVLAGGLAHVSGQLSFIDDVLVKGRLGEDVTIGQGYEAAWRTFSIRQFCARRTVRLPLTSGIPRFNFLRRPRVSVERPELALLHRRDTHRDGQSFKSLPAERGDESRLPRRTPHLFQQPSSSQRGRKNPAVDR